MAWACVVLLVAIVATTTMYLRERAKVLQRNILTRWPIRRIRLHEFDPAFAQGPLGPSLETEVAFIGGGYPVMHLPGGTSDTEAWVLAVLAKRARLMFEFGTCTGRTTWLWARNSPPDATVVTLTLSPDEIHLYQHASGDDEKDARAAIGESAFSSFYYTGTPVEGKVRQLFGDSKTFDESPWAGQCDFVFVDGSHTRSYVESDSRKALRLVRPGGIILWHDYRGPAIRGVYDALNRLARELPLVHIRGTALVGYRMPGDAAATVRAEAR